MIHTKSDSDETSLAVSSPRSPKPPAPYFVQSPSREDSHDGDNKSLPTTSEATPGYSPIDSPSQNSSMFASSASRISGGGFRSSRKRNEKGWPKSHVIDEDEEGYYYDDGRQRKVPWLWLNAALGVILIFSLLCLVIWGVSRNYSPHIAVQGLTVNNFELGQGGDYTGVPTMLLTVNCSVRMVIHNPATFFGIHISSSPVDLFYSRVAVATGQMKRFYQPRKSKRVVSVNVEGKKSPVYGAWMDMIRSGNNKKIRMRLEFDIHSRGNVIGILVGTRHHRHISCFFLMDSIATKAAIKSKKDSCTVSE